MLIRHHETPYQTPTIYSTTYVNDAFTYQVVQCPRYISSIEWRIESQILPELPLKFLKVNIPRITKPRGKDNV